jgi:hypothetical protein
MQLRLAEYGRTLATRPLGARLCSELVSQADGVIELDFSEVLAVSHSFADELLGGLAELAVRPGKEFEIRLVNASSEVRRVIDQAAELRDVHGLIGAAASA